MPFGVVSDYVNESLNHLGSSEHVIQESLVVNRLGHQKKRSKLEVKRSKRSFNKVSSGF